MTTSPLELYGEGLLSTLSLGEDFVHGRTWLRYDDGRSVPLDLPRWAGPTDEADEALLSRCTGPTLDIGCGPGRLTQALHRRGTSCLGVDVAPVAVALARSGGTPVLHASVYDAVLDATRWATVLLADGNVGIGGDPVALLQRAGALTTGNILVEVDPPSVPTSQVQVRIETEDGRLSSWFPWAHVSAADVADVAARAALAVDERWMSLGRHFVSLVPAAPSVPGSDT